MSTSLSTHNLSLSSVSFLTARLQCATVDLSSRCRSNGMAASSTINRPYKGSLRWQSWCLQQGVKLCLPLWDPAFENPALCRGVSIKLLVQHLRLRKCLRSVSSNLMHNDLELDAHSRRTCLTFETCTWPVTCRSIAVGQHQWYHFGVGAPPILEPTLVGMGVLTHSHILVLGGLLQREQPCT